MQSSIGPYERIEINESNWTWYDAVRVKLTHTKDPGLATQNFDQSFSSSSHIGGARNPLDEYLDPAKAEWGSINSLHGRGERCHVILSLRTGVAWIWLNPLPKMFLPQELRLPPKEVILSMSFLVGGFFKNFSIVRDGATVYSNPPSEMLKENPAQWHWSFHRVNSDLQRLVQAAKTSLSGFQVLLAVTGIGNGAKVPPLLTGFPLISHQDKLLGSVARLMTNRDVDCIHLIPSEPYGETRCVKAHRTLLASSCTYFRSLLYSGFSESTASKDVLGGSSRALEKRPERQDVELQYSETESAQDKHDTFEPTKRQKLNPPVDQKGPDTKAREDLDAVPTRSLSGQNLMLLKHDISPRMLGSNCQTIQLHEITFEQLQSLVFFLYTGTCVFKSKVHDAVRIETKRIYQTGPTLSLSPWSQGLLSPCDADAMYRVADKYDVQTLRKAALNHIEAEMTVETLYQDLTCSEHLALFPRIRRAYLEFCFRHQAEIIKLGCYEEIIKLLAG